MYVVTSHIQHGVMEDQRLEFIVCLFVCLDNTLYVYCLNRIDAALARDQCLQALKYI